MRVVHLFKDYYPPTRGGIEQWINEIVHAPQLRAAGIDFVVLTAAHGRELVDEHDDGVRIAVVPFGVDPDEWSMRPPLADEIRARYPGPLVVLLGRLVHYKGAEVLVEAMRDVDATALIVGDGPRRPGAEALAQQLGVHAEGSGRVVFTGAIDDAERAAYLHAADVFVLPSTNRGEAYGIVQLQAMATGTPSISTELGTGTSWVNRDGETGLVVPTRDPVALAKAINELLADDARRAAMGEAASRRVRNELTSEQMFSSLRGLYEAAAG
jgi:rhamnosyl/mannosyltransferase